MAPVKVGDRVIYHAATLYEVEGEGAAAKATPTGKTFDLPAVVTATHDGWTAEYDAAGNQTKVGRLPTADLFVFVRHLPGDANVPGGPAVRDVAEGTKVGQFTAVPAADTSELQSAVASLGSQVSSHGSALSDLGSRVAAIESAAEARVKAVEQHLADLEARLEALFAPAAQEANAKPAGAGEGGKS